MQTIQKAQTTMAKNLAAFVHTYGDPEVLEFWRSLMEKASFVQPTGQAQVQQDLFPDDIPVAMAHQAMENKITYLNGLGDGFHGPEWFPVFQNKNDFLVAPGKYPSSILAIEVSPEHIAKCDTGFIFFDSNGDVRRNWKSMVQTIQGVDRGSAIAFKEVFEETLENLQQQSMRHDQQMELSM